MFWRLFDSSIGYSIFVSFLKITPVNFKLFPIITVVFALVFITLSFVASWIMRQIKFLQKYVFIGNQIEGLL